MNKSYACEDMKNFIKNRTAVLKSALTYLKNSCKYVAELRYILIYKLKNTESITLLGRRK